VERIEDEGLEIVVGSKAVQRWGMGRRKMPANPGK